MIVGLQAGVHAHVFARMWKPEYNLACGYPGAIELSTFFIKTMFFIGWSLPITPGG